MPALSFKARFIPDVAAGRKRQTIRAIRKRPFLVGDPLMFYEGMRTPDCRLVGFGVASEVFRVLFDDDYEIDIEVDGRFRPMPRHAQRELARRDGFQSADDMIDWFANVHGLPFEGQVIRWDELLLDDPRPRPERCQASVDDPHGRRRCARTASLNGSGYCYQHERIRA